MNRFIHKFKDDVPVTVTVRRSVADVLANWASVSRTLNEAIALLDGALFLKDTDLVDRAELCIDELRDLEPALNELHMQVRGRLWLAPHDETPTD